MVIYRNVVNVHFASFFLRLYFIIYFFRLKLNGHPGQYG